MTDFSSLQSKVNDLKAKVEQNSITPAYLGALLDDFIKQMQSIDMTGMSDDVQTAVSNAATALSTAKSALTKAGAAETTATSAAANALSALEKANQALTKAGNAETTAGSAQSTASDAKAMASNAQDNANIAISRADDARTRISAIENKVGAPGGLATLDNNAKIPAANLPGFVDDVVEFNAMVEDVVIQDSFSLKSAYDDGCMLVYDTTTKKLLLAVTTRAVIENGNWGTVLRPGKIAEIAPLDDAEGSYNFSDFWTLVDGKLQLDKTAFRYYANWGDAANFGVITIEGVTPESGKVYICTSDNKTFRWSGYDLVTIGSDLALGETAGTAFAGDKGAQLREDVNALQAEMANKAEATDVERVDKHVNAVHIYPFNGIFISKSADGSVKQLPNIGVWWVPSSDGGAFLFRSSDFDYTVADYNDSGDRKSVV